MRYLLFGLLVGLMSLTVMAKDVDKVVQILEKMETAGDFVTSKSNAIMEIVNADGDKTIMKLISYERRGVGEDEDDKSLMRFTYPARLKGTAILVKGNNIWYYNQRTNRVRLLSSSAKKGSMMGSSFSYEDLEMSYIDDFDGEILKEDRKTYKLKLIPRKDKAYAYLLVRVRKSDYISEKVEYFNEDEIKYKEMISEEIKKIDERVVPLEMVMKDFEENKVTRFIIDEKNVVYDLELDDKIFSEQNLKR